MRMESAAAWAAALLGIAALFLPALRFTGPSVGAQWSAAEVARAAVSPARGGSQPSAREVLARVRALRRQWDALGGRTSAATPWVFRAAIGLPMALLVAGAAAVLLLVCVAAGWRRPRAPAALVGLVAVGYAIGVAALLNREIHREIAAGALRAQHALPLVNFLSVARRLEAQIALRSEVALYVFLAVFLALLLLPAPERAR